jgi:hypothetical protein
MRMAHGGIYRWELARRGNVRACRAAALCDVRSFCLDPRRKAGLGVGFLPELYIREELESGNW